MFLLSLESLAFTQPQQTSQQLVDCIKLASASTGLVLPGDDFYDDFRIGTNFRYDSYYPAVIVNVSSVDDIRASLLCAQEVGGVEISVMNGGHSFEGLSCSARGLLLHLDNFSAVVNSDIGENEAYITVQSGMRLGRLYGTVVDLTDRYAIAGGTCHTVGVTGHTLCGGYGFMGRAVGLTSDQLVSIEVMLANGDVITANDTSHSELFWALRGGCSSAFGVVVSLKFKLTKLVSNTAHFTRMSLPAINYNTSQSIDALLWWTAWASDAEKSPIACTSVLNFGSKGFIIQMLYMGSKSEAVDSTFQAISAGLQGLLSDDTILASYLEGSYLDAIIWWTSDSSIKTVEDLLAVTSLPPLEQRSDMHRKAKSALSMPGQLSADAVKVLIDDYLSGKISQVEWKAYGGVYNDIADKLYVDDKRSPLFRGKAFEMHYGQIVHPVGGESPLEMFRMDQELVASVNAVSVNISLSGGFSGYKAYPGYIDLDLPNKGAEYFGDDGASHLDKIRQFYDPFGVFSSKASEYLYQHH
jgi:hypothetical protein